MALERNQWLAIGILSGMAYLFGKERGEAESFEAEDSRRRLKVLMEGKSKEERKRISKMVQVRGLENTIAELMANAEAFAATTFDEDDDDSPKINRDEWMPRTDCEICARPFTINRFGQQLIQHYLKESDNGEKADIPVLSWNSTYWFNASNPYSYKKNPARFLAVLLTPSVFFLDFHAFSPLSDSFR